MKRIKHYIIVALIGVAAGVVLASLSWGCWDRPTQDKKKIEGVKDEINDVRKAADKFLDRHNRLERVR